MLKRLKSSPLFKFFASLKLAVFSLLTLAAVLATATILESLYGTRAVHVLVYDTWWFGGVLLMLGTNVFCAAAIRYPWKRSQTGFVITHTGILVILAGSFLTQQLGVDGSLPVVEGQQERNVILNDLTLTVSDEDNKKSQTYALPEYALRKQGKLVDVALSPTQHLVVDDFLPRASFERKISKSPLPGVGLPAVHVELFNSRFRVDEWLQARHPEKATELNLGPAVLSFKKLWTKEQEKEFLSPFKPKEAAKKTKYGYVVAQYQGKEYRVEIGDALKKWQPLGEGVKLTVHVERYLPYAIVEDNKLVNKSDDPVNPAVQLLLRDANGTEEQHTLFANFPEFGTLHKAHQRPGQKSLGVKFRMIGAGSAPDATASASGMGRGQLMFAQSADDKRLLYVAKGKAGDLKASGVVKVGEPMVTGWMDLQFNVSDWYPSSIEEDDPRYIEYIQGQDSNFLSGIHIKAGDQGYWLMEGSTRSVSLGGREMFVQFGKRRMELPFAMKLDKFTMGTDPGTTKAASYQSNVTVKDPTAGIEKTALISMNEPLQYGGYTFYQASYQMDDGRPPVSIFSVNHDPGRPVKYAGSLIMVLGIIVMFWWNPHYFGKILGGAKARRKEEVAA